ncbi:MAG: CaiB/BaiF CoA-transferase family protein [Spirochaetota bacterium]|nr:CaiB/BaiF CoA-transferase family protein [Spirochaetota bacterium]
MSITKGPLSGIRVLDLTHAHAGPYGTMLLGYLGAEVIKLEPPTGEMMRMGETEVSLKSSYYIIALNPNKNGLVLDLKGRLGKQAFYDLVKKSDVVYSNTRAEVPKRQGTDYETLSRINRRIIRCNISGYGETGPYISYPSYDIIASGHSGILSICGEEGRNPVIPGGIALADMMGGIFASMSIIAALVKRNRDGMGMKIETNLLDSLLVMQQVKFQNYFLTGKEPGMQGRRHARDAGYGIYETKDGFITLASSTNQEKLMELIGLNELINDPRYKTSEERNKHKKELDNSYEEALRKKTTEEWIKLLRDENDIPCGPVVNYDEIMKDPQVKQNRMFIEMELKGEKYNSMNSIFKLCNKSNQSVIEGNPEPPPDVGEHTGELLKSILGYSDELIKEIKAENEASIPRLKKRLKSVEIDEEVK